MSGPSIAIVGGGFSGASLATQILASSKRAPPRIFLIDRSGKFGPGLAYSTSHPSHLMNVRAPRLSAAPDQPNDFVEWLSARNGGTDTSQFAQRSAYGAYLEACVRRAAREFPPGALNFIREAAVSCAPETSGVHVVLQSGATLNADAAVLALGNQPSLAPAPFDADPEIAGQLIDPWGPELEHIRPEDDVLLIGTGLTMTDALLRLASTPRSGRVFALSRRGLLSRPHAHQANENTDPFWVEGQLSEMLAQMRREIEATIARGQDWQNVFDRLRPETVDTWISLPPALRARFLRHLRPYWDAHRHRAPPHIHAWLDGMRKAGSLEIHAGRISKVARDGDSFSLAYRPRGQNGEGRIRVKHIVNCTGPCADLTRSRDALIQQVLSEGVARVHATGLGLDVEPNGRIVSAAGIAQPHLFALGPLTQGAFWESTAVPEIRANAAAMAKTLLAQLPRTGLQSIGEPVAAAARRPRKLHGPNLAAPH